MNTQICADICKIPCGTHEHTNMCEYLQGSNICPPPFQLILFSFFCSPKKKKNLILNALTKIIDVAK